MAFRGVYKDFRAKIYACYIAIFAPNLLDFESVIALGNSTFQWNLDPETAKLHKNHFLEFAIYTQIEKYHTFFVNFTRVHKTWNKCQFFSDEVEYF